MYATVSPSGYENKQGAPKINNVTVRAWNNPSLPPLSITVIEYVALHGPGPLTSLRHSIMDCSAWGPLASTTCVFARVKSASAQRGVTTGLLKTRALAAISAAQVFQTRGDHRQKLCRVLHTEIKVAQLWRTGRIKPKSYRSKCGVWLACSSIHTLQAIQRHCNQWKLAQTWGGLRNAEI